MMARAWLVFAILMAVAALVVLVVAVLDWRAERRLARKLDQLDPATVARHVAHDVLTDDQLARVIARWGADDGE